MYPKMQYYAKSGVSLQISRFYLVLGKLNIKISLLIFPILTVILLRTLKQLGTTQ